MTPTAPTAAAGQFDCRVAVRFLPEQSDPAEPAYAFAYTVTIHNRGLHAAQLVARRWLITDASGRIEEVRGLAVVGNQPLLQPGARFEYTSWVRIATPQGSMQGTFYCITDDAHWFDAAVPEFALAQSSSQLH